MTPTEIAALSLEELEALGIDTCGLPLSECPGSPQPGPLTSWKARRDVNWTLSGPRKARKPSAASQPVVNVHGRRGAYKRYIDPEVAA